MREGNKDSVNDHKDRCGSLFEHPMDNAAVSVSWAQQWTFVLDFSPKVEKL